MYASSNLYTSSYVPSPLRPATPAASPVLPPAPPAASAPLLGQDVFVPSSAYTAAAPYTSPAPYTAPSPYAPASPAVSYAPEAPAGGFKIFGLADIPGTPERMKKLTKEQMAPYFEAISQALRMDSEVSMAVTFGVHTDAQKLRLVERVKEIVSGIYQLPPIQTQILDEPWVGGGYSFDANYLYTITTGLLNDAKAGDLVYLTVHEMTHAFQHRMVSLPIRPGGDLGELVDAWRGNTPQSHGYISYTDASNFELYAEQPLEFAAFLAGNFAEYQLTGGNNRLWGTNETEAWDLYA